MTALEGIPVSSSLLGGYDEPEILLSENHPICPIGADVAQAAILALKNPQTGEKFEKGVEMIYNQLSSTLESEGLRPIQALGKKLDPHFHDVMLKHKSDKEEGMILDELQKGYMLNDRVLRHSKVKY